MFLPLNNVSSHIPPNPPFRKGEGSKTKVFQGIGIKVLSLLLVYFFIMIVAFPLSVHSADTAWKGLIQPYCHGTGLNKEGVEVPDGSCTLCDGIHMFKGFLDFLMFSLALPIAMIAVLVAGVQYTLAGADPSQAGKARKLLTDTVKGLVFMFCAWLIINTMFAAFGASAIQGAWDPGKWFVIKCM